MCELGGGIGLGLAWGQVLRLVWGSGWFARLGPGWGLSQGVGGREGSVRVRGVGGSGLGVGL